MTPRTNDGKEKKEKGKEGRGMVNFSLLPVTLSPRGEKMTRALAYEIEIRLSIENRPISPSRRVSPF